MKLSLLNGNTTKLPVQKLGTTSDPSRIISENDLAYAVHDGYPVTELHTLIPKGDTEIRYLGFRVRPVRTLVRICHQPLYPCDAGSM
jgi:hypothetical protein